MKPSTALEIVAVCLIAIVGLFVLTSCQSGGGVIPRTESGSVDWEEVERIRAEIEEARKPAPDEDQEEPAPEPDNDEFPESVTWLHPDVSGWPVTSPLSVNVTASRITLDYNKARVWPAREEAGATVNANPWVVAEVDGKWYAGTWEWLRYGQTVKNNVVRGDHVKRPPMDGDWKPESGQRVGIFVSGLIRGRTRNVSERTELVWVVWP